MSVFLSERYAQLEPYPPGEQPQDRRYIKLNTNESPFPPSPGVLEAVREEAGRLQLYSDPESRTVTCALAEHYGLQPDQVLVGNGSDELLNFAFMAYYDDGCPALFPDVTYGFYPVFAGLHRIQMIVKSFDTDNDNRLSSAEIERMLQARPSYMHVIDEAYVDFGAESVLPLIHRYENLLVIQTFSKSRSLAGARLGFAAGQAPLIRDLNTLKYSTNPYNVNRMTSAAGTAALKEDEYYRRNARIIMENRAWTAGELKRLGFTVTDSRANFLFAACPELPGEKYYLAMKEQGILVRYLKGPRLKPFVRITVGTKQQMETLIRETETLLKTEAATHA